MQEKFFMNGIFRDTKKGPWPFYTRCKNCGAVFFPAELIMCNQCVGKELEQFDLPEEGIIESFTVLYRPVNQYKVPHCICVIAFPEQKLKVKGILEVSDEYLANMEKGHEFKIGSKVETIVTPLWEDAEEDTRYIGYKFRLKEEK